MVKLLVAAGVRARLITDILIGYQWTGSRHELTVVDLQPTYYVEMKGEYRDYTSWLKLSSDASAHAECGQTATPRHDDSSASESEHTT